MNDKDLEKDLEKLKKQIPVNSELKQNLRKSYVIRRRNTWIKRISTIAAALIIVFTAVLLPDNMTVKKVKADAFKISNQISYAEISSGNGIEINEYKGIQYITINQKGIYKYDNTGYQSIYEGDLNSARLSADGKRFVISAGGNLYLFEIETKKKTELVKGNNISIYMEEPSWADEEHILYTKKVIEPAEPHGFNIKESSIFMMDINSMQSQKITDGSNSSFAAGKNAIVFERDNKIIYRDLKDGNERVVDDGRFPDVSPDGRYIAYVKTESSIKKLAENANVVTSMSNVWITDMEEFKLKQPVTFNFPNKYMDENEWLKSLEKVEDKSIPQQLVFSGVYDYYNPVWSSNSKSLFIIKFLSSGEQGSRIVRIDFADQNMTDTDTVKRYIQALIVRDDDYAKSLMKNPPELLTISNPHRSGYNIISDGKDESGYYVEAEVYWQYTGTPYYSIEKSKYYVSRNEDGYLIDSIKLINRTELYFKNGSIYIKEDNEEKELFSEGNIPSEYYQKGKSQVLSAAFNAKNGNVIFTSYEDQNEISNVKVIEYNVANQNFKLIDKISAINNEKILGTSNLSLDSTGKYAAFNVYYGVGEDIKNTIVAYNLFNNQKINIDDISEKGFTSLYTSFFEDNRLIFTAAKNNEEVKYKYDFEKGTLSSF